LYSVRVTPTFFLLRQKESSKEKGDFLPKAPPAKKWLYAVGALLYL
jgi:hypothetical protein